jgi:hypothetical protein
MYKCEDKSPPAVPLNHHTADSNTPITIAESEWKALSRCRRVWAAMALCMVLRGQTPLAEIGVIFDCAVGELEDLQRGAKLNSGRVQRFCSEVGWSPLERLVNDFKSTLDASVPKELQSLVEVPHLTVKIARVLVDSGKILTCSDLARCSLSTLVRLLHLSLGFEKQVRLSRERSFDRNGCAAVLHFLALLTRCCTTIALYCPTTQANRAVCEKMKNPF